MAKFIGDEMKVAEAKENEKAMQNMSMTLKLVDKTTGEEYNLEDEKIAAIRFKEKRGQLFIRLKGENGMVLSIPKQKLPSFIKVEETKKSIW